MMDLFFTKVPRACMLLSSRKNQRLLSLVQSSRRTTTTSEVVQAGTASSTHIIVANTKMETSRCSTKVRSGMPSISGGISQRASDTMMAAVSFTIRDGTLFSESRFDFFCE